MALNSDVTKRNSLFKILLLINLMVMAIWIVGQSMNVYRYAVVGAVFELFWLPLIAAIIGMPMISCYFWYKDKFKVTSKFLYLLLGSMLLITSVVVFSR